MDRIRQTLPLLAWFASLAVGIVLFTALGDGDLAAPPLGTPSAWGDWAAARDPIIAAVALLRLLVLALSWYLVAVTSIGLVARLTRAARLVRIADALSLPVVRNVLQGALGLTLAVGVVAASSGPVPGTRHGEGPARDAVSVSQQDTVTGTPVALSQAVAAMVALDGADGEAGEAGEGGASMVALGSADGEAGAGSASMVAIGDTAEHAEMVALDGEVDRAEMVALEEASGTSMRWLAPPGSSVSDDEDAVAEHEVVGGDHLWSIAETTVAEHLGRAPSEAEVAAYWQQLIDANRDRLADPDNPDLIFPGQQLTLPEPGPGSGSVSS